MQKISTSFVVAICGVMTLVSCDKDATSLLTLQPEPTSVLRVQTRTGELDASIAQTCIYLFDGDGKCKSILHPDADEYAALKLPAGRYTLCAVGGASLTCFTLPTENEASPSSLITLAEEATMGDILMASSTILMTDGDSRAVNLELNRQVLEISSVAIKEVPENVTNVSVTVSSIYSGIQLNGDLPSSMTTSCTIPLDDTGEDGVWQSSDPVLTFPSKGAPVITVTFTTRDSDTPRSYAYTTDEPLVANCKFSIEGTYTEPKGVTITGTISAQAWNTAENKVTFDFDESNATTNTDDNNGGSDEVPLDSPVAGSTYLGYYVVSVDTETKTAILLSTVQYNEIYGEAGLKSAMASISKPEGIENSWRLPTADECKVFLSDVNTPKVYYGYPYYCLDSEVISRILYKKQSDGTIVYESLRNTIYTDGIYLRPVIDISF